MFSRLFGKSLPGPTKDQDAADLRPFVQGNDAEITAAAFEPRFSLLAFGNAEGRLFVMNSKRAVVSSAATMGCPICTLTACPNSSSFISLFSQYSYEHHPSAIAPMQIAKNEKPKYATFLSSRCNKTGSVICHWIVTPERAVPRIVSSKENIITLCISPSAPNFALVLQENGALMGFSLEKMQFTDLYINKFEGKPTKCLSCPSGMKFYIAADKISALNIKSMELDEFSSLAVASIDVLGSSAAVISSEGKAQLIKGSKVISESKSNVGGIGIISQIIDAENWISVVRSPVGDEVFLNGKKIDIPQGIWFVPSLLVSYASFYERMKPIKIQLMTGDAMIATLEDGHITFAPVFPRKIQPDYVVHDGGRILAVKREEKGFTLYVFTKYSFVSEKHYDLPFPVEYRQNFLICMAPDSVQLIDTLTGNVSFAFDHPVAHFISGQKQITFFVDNKQLVLSDDGKIIESPDKLIVAAKPEVQECRRIGKEELCLTTKGSILFKDQETKIADGKEKIIVFELINEFGRAVEGGQFLLVVTQKVAYLYEPLEQMKSIRKMKFDDEIDDATVFEWGGLLIKFGVTSKILALPDFTLPHLGLLKLTSSEHISIIKKFGLFISEEKSISIYSNDHTPCVLYRESTPPIEEPPKKSLFGAEKADTPEQVDASFCYTRTKSSLEQTKQIMQQLLVTAQERNEVLNELEMKAIRLCDHAREFYELSRKFKR